MSDHEALRIIPRRGKSNIRRIGLRSRPLNDLYHVLLQLRWSVLFLWAAGLYVLINAVFAALYLSGDHVAGLTLGDFEQAFAFSVQTLTTIGYGAMSPQSSFGHALVALEALLGLMAFALITGLIFAKFSRPTSRVMFSEHAVISMHDGMPCLMFRMANERLRSRIVEAQLKLTLTRDETTLEGVFMRRFYDMNLTRSTTPIFALTWTAVHPIDADSPLAGATPESLDAQNAEVVASFVGIDETMSQTLHGRFSWLAREISFGSRLCDLMSTDADGTRIFDYTKFHSLEPVPDDGSTEAIALAIPRTAGQR